MHRVLDASISGVFLGIRSSTYFILLGASVSMRDERLERKA